MDIFDIIGPVMVGPSSSHTAGAVRIGYIAGKLMGEPIAKAEILLYGSFLATGKGHGTRKALVAGLLGMKPDDMRIPDSFEIAKEHGIEVAFGESALRDAHPNTAQIFLTSVTGKNLEVVGESLGGSRINIAAMQLYRAGRGGNSVMVLECDQEVPEEGINWLRHAEGVVKVTYLGLE